MAEIGGEGNGPGRHDVDPNGKQGPAIEYIKGGLDKKTDDAFTDIVRQLVRHPDVDRILEEVDKQIEEIDEKKNGEKRHSHRRRKTFLSRKYHPKESETHERFKPKYTPPEGDKSEAHLPDHEPMLDPKTNEEFATTVNEILDRIEDKPESATLEDLQLIIGAEEKDLLEQKDSYDRLTKAIPLAREFLMNKENPRRVNVSFSQDDNGEWVAEVGAKEGNLYSTFNLSRILELKNPVQFYKSSLNVLGYATDALAIMKRHGKLVENDAKAQSLYTFLREKIGYLEAGKKAVKNPDALERADKALALFKSFSNRVNKYKTSIDLIGSF